MIFSYFLVIMILPPIILIIMGQQAKPNAKREKQFYILAVVYLIICLGTCAGLIYSI